MEMPKQQNFMDTETIKLSKMSKGYNWEIKLVDKIDVDRLEQINTEMMKRFGSLEA